MLPPSPMSPNEPEEGESHPFSSHHGRARKMVRAADPTRLRPLDPEEVLREEVLSNKIQVFRNLNILGETEAQGEVAGIRREPATVGGTQVTRFEEPGAAADHPPGVGIILAR